MVFLCACKISYFLMHFIKYQQAFFAPLPENERHKAIKRIDQLILIGVPKLFTTTLAGLSLFSIYFILYTGQCLIDSAFLQILLKIQNLLLGRARRVRPKKHQHLNQTNQEEAQHQFLKPWLTRLSVNSLLRAP